MFGSECYVTANLSSLLTFTARHQTPCRIPPFISKTSSIQIWPDLLYPHRKNREREGIGGNLELNTTSFSCQIFHSLLYFKEPLQEFIFNWHVCQRNKPTEKLTCDTGVKQNEEDLRRWWLTQETCSVIYAVFFKVLLTRGKKSWIGLNKAQLNSFTQLLGHEKHLSKFPSRHSL